MKLRNKEFIYLQCVHTHTHTTHAALQEHIRVEGRAPRTKMLIISWLGQMIQGSCRRTWCFNFVASGWHMLLPAVFGRQRKFFPGLQDLKFWRLSYHQFQSILFLPVCSANIKLISTRVHTYIQEEQTWLFSKSVTIPNFSFYQMLRESWLQTCHLFQKFYHLHIWASENPKSILENEII